MIPSRKSGNIDHKKDMLWMPLDLPKTAQSGIYILSAKKPRKGLIRLLHKNALLIQLMWGNVLTMAPLDSDSARKRASAHLPQGV